MKRLYFISFLCTLAFWTIIIIANFFLSNYYETDFFRDNDWKEVFLVFFAVIMIASLISLLIFRTQPFLKKFLITFSCVCTILTIIVTIHWTQTFLQILEEQNQLINKFKKEAENDIKNDNVKIFSQGLPLPPKNEILQIQDDSIQKVWKKFGLTRKNIGCIISPEITKAQEEYYKLTDIYLEKRNGPGWKVKMENEIDNIRNHR